MRVIIGLQSHVESKGEPRYLDQAEVSKENLAWMLNKLMADLDGLPSDKVNRWIGFVQGVLAAQGYMSVKEERDRTRPLFHDAYKKNGNDIPPTLERE